MGCGVNSKLYLVPRDVDKNCGNVEIILRCHFCHSIVDEGERHCGEFAIDEFVKDENGIEIKLDVMGERNGREENRSAKENA